MPAAALLSALRLRPMLRDASIAREAPDRSMGRRSFAKRVEFRLGSHIEPLSDQRGSGGDSLAKIGLMQDLRFLAARLENGHFAVERRGVDTTVGGHGRRVIASERTQPFLHVEGRSVFRV